MGSRCLQIGWIPLLRNWTTVMKVLVTGSAGFIGAAVAHALVQRGDEVLGIDNFDPYYNPLLKHARIASLQQSLLYQHMNIDIADSSSVEFAFAEFRPDVVVHLAAQAGVRHASKDPSSYGRSNLIGFLNILESSKNRVQHLIYASSSSVYGLNKSFPFVESDSVMRPTSLYAATKVANEVMAHTYSFNFNLRTTGMRFFTVYGPWGRPDMMPMKFARLILAGQPIELFNSGDHSRDFTYIDDVVEGVLKILDNGKAREMPVVTNSNDEQDSPPFTIFNIGGENPIHLLKFVELLENQLGKTAIKVLAPRQLGEMSVTHANNEKLRGATGWQPRISIEEGVRRFAEWARLNINYLQP